jgi:antitoxin MazE
MNKDWEKFTVQSARVFKAGNSLAIRIPSVMAKQCGLQDGQPVDMAVNQGVIHIRKPQRELDDLIARITPQNVHGEMFENLVERERW